MSMRGLSKVSVFTFSMSSTTSVPLYTLPKTVCLLSSLRVIERYQVAGAVVTKNWEPLVPGKLRLAMLTVKALSCLSDGWNSSSNSPPQIDSPG